MSSISVESGRVAAREVSIPATEGNSIGWWLRDIWELNKRNFRHILRTPELLLDVTIQPIMFVLLFRYVFGGAIPTGDISYVNFLMAGIFVQTIAFAMLWSGVLIANDLQKGIIDRFRALPMLSWAVPVARTLTDLFRSMIAITIMIAVGLAVGFRPDANLVEWAGAIGMLLLFGFALAWIGITLGMAVRTPEAATGAIFVFVFPLTFASSAFVPVETMPGWLQKFTEHQPITVVIDTVRALMLGRDPGSAGVEALA
ncbi:MAG: ABC transporter permease, partial [Chloroflexota bacterium]|nr:ABC transporter permease [Chloroflexota bacterium]